MPYQFFHPQIQAISQNVTDVPRGTLQDGAAENSPTAPSIWTFIAIFRYSQDDGLGVN
jgi:hypothetical protein